MPVDLTRLNDIRCERAGDNHSDDRVAMYHGHVIPTILCGYHASKFPDRSDS